MWGGGIAPCQVVGKGPSEEMGWALGWVRKDESKLPMERALVGWGGIAVELQAKGYQVPKSQSQKELGLLEEEKGVSY